LLMRVFRDVELVESLGSGMTRILQVYDPSIFELTPSFLVATFKLRPAGELGSEPVNGQKDEGMDGTIDGTIDGTKDGTIDGTKELLETVLALLRHHPSITRNEIASKLSASPRTVSRAIKTLVETKRIYRSGGRQFGHWAESRAESGAESRLGSRLESRLESRPESLEEKMMKLLGVSPLSRTAIAKKLKHKNISGRIHRLISIMLAEETIERTLPEKPNSRLQQYRLTQKGRQALATRGASRSAKKSNPA